MRLLQRPKRERWALAAVAWLGGCGVVWWMLPGVPRVVVPYAEAGLPHGFTAHGRGLHGRMYGTFNPATNGVRMGEPGLPKPDGPFRIWDLQSGHPNITWSPPESIIVHHLMLAHEAALVSAQGPAAQPIALLDLRTNKREVLPLGDPGVGEAILTPDGRYLVYVADKPAPYATCWWDRKTQKLIGEFARLVPDAVAPDGRWLTVDRAGRGVESTQLTVHPLASADVMTQVNLSERFDAAWFSDDGGYLLIRAESGVQVAELPSGKVCASKLNGIRFFVLPELRQVVAEELVDHACWLVRWDLVTGESMQAVGVVT